MSVAPEKPRPESEPRTPGRGMRDQIARYRTAFIAIVVMVVLAVISGGYILAHERLSLPSWFPFVGSNTFPIEAEFETSLALAPGQGEPVTIAGAKIGEVSSVRLSHGIAIVGLAIERRYAHDIYRNATMLMHPKTQLKDETVNIEPGSESAGAVREGEMFHLQQTAPDVNFEEFINSFDGETRHYLQALLASVGTALKDNGRPLSADYRRFYPLTRDIQEISAELEKRQRYIARSIHNFQLIIKALDGKEHQIAEVIQASNEDFKAFYRQDEAVERTIKELPSTLRKTKSGLGKFATATRQVGSTLKKLQPFAESLKPAQVQGLKLFKKTTPIIEHEIRPFTREILPVLEQIGPATKDFDKALPSLSTSFDVLNQFFNELAYNPGKKQAGFLFFLDWANHDFNSALSTADAAGPTGRIQLYFNCELAGILGGVAEINPNVRTLIHLLRPPEAKECEETGITPKPAG